MSKLDTLLDFIQKFHGINTYPGADANNDKIHAGCCELEAMGKLERITDEEKHVLWGAVSDVPSD